MNEAEKYIREKLFACQDLKYKDFQAKLIPNISPETIIGVRTPQLRAIGKQFSKTEYTTEFLDSLPHEYYDENNIHGYLIGTLTDYDETIRRLEEFLPYVDNWASCDTMSPKIFKKHLPELLEKVKQWCKSDDTYTVRFAVGTLMSYYLDGVFQKEFLEIPVKIESDEYYIKMMIAWFFATALAKQYDATLPYIEQRRLEKWTHNKTISKAIESYRITAEQKAYLRTLKIK